MKKISFAIKIRTERPDSVINVILNRTTLCGILKSYAAHYGSCLKYREVDSKQTADGKDQNTGT